MASNLKTWIFRAGGFYAFFYLFLIVFCIAVLVQEVRLFDLVNEYSLGAWETTEGCTLDISLSPKSIIAIVAGSITLGVISLGMWFNTIVVRLTCDNKTKKWWATFGLILSIPAILALSVTLGISYAFEHSGQHQTGCNFPSNANIGTGLNLGVATCSYQAVACGFVQPERQYYFKQHNRTAETLDWLLCGLSILTFASQVTQLRNLPSTDSATPPADGGETPDENDGETPQKDGSQTQGNDGQTAHLGDGDVVPTGPPSISFFGIGSWIKSNTKKSQVSTSPHILNLEVNNGRGCCGSCTCGCPDCLCNGSWRPGIEPESLRPGPQHSEENDEGQPGPSDYQSCFRDF
ncbi:hypothetical protein BDV96DRAFT_600117 [Lophiotrema nucula]|uniref:Transmembrane protein n=1 Tax=Lophiotrema nucula TaxID=690887 RepID=A0A6A5Z7D4_9PLEO|nr:hypothetical protein BDV96DRAFT_600117 [Lophiotrema nucula]